jgi:hypothetical protein
MASDKNNKTEVALYIGSLAEELARLAKNNQFEALAYILDMARLEADQVSRRFNGQPSSARSGLD